MGEEKHCLICYENFNNFNEDQFVQLSDKGQLIGKQLDAIFLLKELLNVPNGLIKNWFKVSGGDNPDGWISVCDKCGERVGEARRVFRQLVEASRRFKEVQGEVVRMVKESCKISGAIKDDLARNKLIKEISEVVTEESRKFVSKHDYGSFNDPFTLGDLQAERKLQAWKLKQVALANEEQPDAEEDQDGRLWDSFSSIASDLDAPLSPEVTFMNEDPTDNHNDLDDKASSEGDNLTPKKSEPGTSRRKRRKKLPKKPPTQPVDNSKSIPCPAPDCTNLYKNKSTLYHHLRRYHSALNLHKTMTFECSECSKVYTSIGGLYCHQKAIHEKQPKNYHLTRTPAAKERARARLKMWNAKNQFPCPHCDFISHFKTVLDQHIKRKHEHGRLIFCEICGKGVVCSFELRRHQADIHSLCSVEGCKLSFGGREELRRHQVENHGKEIDVFACDECESHFVLKRYLRRHKQIHEHKRRAAEGGEGGGGGGQFICDLCGKQYALQEYLYYHTWHTHRKQRKNSKRGDHSSSQNAPNS